MENFRLFLNKKSNGDYIVLLFVREALLKALPDGASFTVANLFQINEDWDFYHINHEPLFHEFDAHKFEQYVRSQMVGMVQRYVYDYVVVPEADVDVDRFRTSIIIGNSIDINRLHSNFSEVK